MPEMFTTDCGRNACRRPCAPPSTFPAGMRYSGPDPTVPSRGGAAGNGWCFMTSRLSTVSRSLSVPKPKVLICFFDDA